MTSGRVGLRVAALALAVAACGAAQARRGVDSWLDQPLVNWNRSGAAMPTAGPWQGDPPGTGRCRESLRAAEGAEDRAVTAAGWALFGSVPGAGATAVVLGMTGADGMCRPLGFQAFVFARGRFAGTLSPVPMNARTDGVQTRVHVAPGGAGLEAEFARYTSDDPLCCPSRLSRVTYRLEQGARGNPLLVPVEIRTEPTR